MQNYGTIRGELLEQRMGELKAATNLEEMYQVNFARFHPLKGNRHGQFAVDLQYPYRLILEPVCEELPMKNETEVDLSKIFAVKIIEVEDYH